MTAPLAWMAEAACRTVRCFTELPEREQRAICYGCPVQLDCLEFAITGPPMPLNGPRGGGVVYGARNQSEIARLQRSRRLALQRQAVSA